MASFSNENKLVFSTIPFNSTSPVPTKPDTSTAANKPASTVSASSVTSATLSFPLESTTIHTHSSDSDTSFYCGLFNWRPFCLQRTSNIHSFLAAACFISFLQASFSGYISSQVTTLEKRFAIGSSTIGIINSFFEIGYIVSVVFVSYAGSRRHVPRWIASGLFAMSAGSFLFSLPHFLFPQSPQQHSVAFSSSSAFDKSGELCHKNLSNRETSPFVTPAMQSSSVVYGYGFLPILLIAQLLIGAGSSPILTLTPPFIDDHVDPTKAPSMIASQYASAAMGPVFGFALGALVLYYPADLTASFSQSDPDFIGCWWLGYIVLAILVLFGAMILLFFPRRLHAHSKSIVRSKRVHHGSLSKQVSLENVNLNGSVAQSAGQRQQTTDSLNGQLYTIDSTVCGRPNWNYSAVRAKKPLYCCLSQIRGRVANCPHSWSKFSEALKSIFHNGNYILICICICFEMFLVIGFASFLPKYLEAEYHISKSATSAIAGGLVVPAGALGILVGGFVLNRFKLHRRAAIRFVLCVNLVILACIASFFGLGCDSPRLVGITTDYPNLSKSSVVTTNGASKPVSCHSQCSCDQHHWAPVCDPSNGLSYISPCRAGCTVPPASTGSDLVRFRFVNCSCSFAHTAGTGQLSTSALLSGICPVKCDRLIYFICSITLCLFLTGVVQNPLLMVTMRTVNHAERSFALGLQFVIIRILANLPSPMVFGRVIDSACRHWRYTGDRRGDCAFLDGRHLNYYLTGLAFTVKGTGLLFYLILLIKLRYSHSSLSIPMTLLNRVSQRKSQNVVIPVSDSIDNNLPDSR